MDIGQYLQPKKEKDDKLIRILTVVGVVLAAAQLVVSLLQIGGRIFAWSGLVLAVAVFAAVLYAPVTKIVRRVGTKSSNKRFIAEYEPPLLELFGRFAQHTSQSLSNQPYLLIRNAVDTDQRLFDSIFGSTALSSWQNALETRLSRPCVDLEDFVQRCHDFTMLVHHYNTDVIVKARAELLKLNSPKAASYAEPLEVFRVEFTRFLQDVELWAKKVNEFALKRFPQSKFYKLSPHWQFERVGTFLKNAITTAL